VVSSGVRRALLITASLVTWTFLAVSCGGIVTMSTADSVEPHAWPVGATVALIVLALVWVGVPVLAWRELRRHR
jgi:hypothetical protein